MTSRLILTSLLALSFAAPALANDIKPDDTVSLELSAEDWVTTKTARVDLDVEAAVSAANEGTMRADMTKAVNDAAKGDWRLTNFTRSTDQTGMERWSVTFEARLPETALNGLTDAVKKASKAGMQLKVDTVDFTPTLEETEAAKAALRTRVMKDANDQLATLNTTLAGRQYRISDISFQARPYLLGGVRKPMAMMAMASGNNASDDSAPQEHAQKMVVEARVVYAALAPVAK
jgi:hypothetical protein